MRRFRGIVESKYAPSDNMLWVYKGVVKYFTNGTWKEIGGANNLNWSDITGKPTFADVATSGNYSDLKGVPVKATTGADGLMSKEDKAKLDGVAANANNYTHPTTAGNKHVPTGGSANQILVWKVNGEAQWGAVPAATSGAYGGVKKGAAIEKITNPSSANAEEIANKVNAIIDMLKTTELTA